MISQERVSWVDVALRLPDKDEGLDKVVEY